MWFKNLMLYRLTEAWALSPEELGEKLREHEFVPCGSLDPMRYGFTPPLGDHGTELVHATNGNIMICVKRQEKILPGGVVNEQLDAKVKAIYEAEQRPVSRKERDALKDEIIFSLLPKAFTRSTLEYAYIALQDGLIVVNASSATKAEDLISKLREALGSLRCLPLSPKAIPTQMMTHWLQEGAAPARFELGQEVTLLATKDGRAVSCKKLDITAPEVRNHIESGMHVGKLSLIWNECITFVVDDQMSIKGLKFDDAISAKANDRNPESRAEQFDADFAVMSFELKHFIAAVLAAFGGESDAAFMEPLPAVPAAAPAETEEDQAEGDALLADAIRFVTESRKASISSLQRHLRLGYNRSARLIEAMEARGIISPAAHNGERRVLVHP